MILNKILFCFILDKMFKSDDLQLTFVKNCDHLLINNKNGFNLLTNTIKDLLEIDNMR